jgi:hypothetical protein
MHIGPFFSDEIPQWTSPLSTSSSQSQPPASLNTPHSGSSSDERFQYASCPQCHSHRARLTKHTRGQWHIFSIFCPFCGYEDADVSDT